MFKKLLPSLVVCGVGFISAPVHAADFLWSDTYLSYRYLWQDKQPGTNRDVREHAVNLSHADSWTYGQNFFSLDIEQFTHEDPANIAGTYGEGGTKSTGSGEFYGLFRSTFSGNKIFATKAFAFGPISDIGLEIGADWCTQNDAFASNKKMIVVGPQFSFAMPRGFWNFSVHIAHEWNTDGFYSDGSSDNFDTVPELETAWLYPFAVGPVPLSFTGYANVIFPKGHGRSEELGSPRHDTEVLAHPKLMVDAGKMLGFTPAKFETGVGFEYWLHKFGAVSTPQVPAPVQRAWFFEVGYHF